MKTPAAGVCRNYCPFVHEHNTICSRIMAGLLVPIRDHAEWLCEIMDTYCRPT